MIGLFLFATASTTLSLWPTHPPIQWVAGALFLGLKRPDRESDHSPPPSAEVENAWSYTYALHQYVFIVSCLVRHFYVTFELCSWNDRVLIDEYCERLWQLRKRKELNGAEHFSYTSRSEICSVSFATAGRTNYIQGRVKGRGKVVPVLN
jgi:hypothetical protein